MAKASVDTIGLGTLSAGLRREVATLKRPVMDAAARFSAIREKLADLAPKVYKLFTRIQAEQERFTFVQFARLFDPSVPMAAGGDDGYRNHRTYYTLQYMRRVATAQTGQRNRGQQGVRDSAVDTVARTLATILAIVAESDHEKIWLGLQKEQGLTERVLTRLRKRVADTKPLFSLTTTKPATVAKVIHMPSPKTDGAGEPMEQPGRNVELAERPRARKAS